jgi:O-antigen/teichoic acid export membrane protein
MAFTIESQPTTKPQEERHGVRSLHVDNQRRSAEWDVRCGPQNYLALVGSQTVSSALSFAAIAIATRILGSAGYGGIAAILAASQCISQVAVQWTAVSVSRYGCEEFVQTGRVARAFWTRLLILVPNLLLVIVASSWWLPPIADWLTIPASAYPLILAHFLATAFWVHVQQTLQAAKLPRLQGTLLAVERAQIVLILVALFFVGRASLLSVMWAYILAPLCACGIGLWRLRSLVLGIVFDRPLLKQILHFSVPLVPYSVVGYLFTNHLDAFFITRFLSKSHLGVYAVAYQLTGALMQLPVLAGSLLLPLFVTLQVNGRENPVVRYLRDVLPLLTLAWSTLCAIAAAVGGALAPAVFGASFREVTWLLFPLMAASALAGPWLMGCAPASNAQSATYITTIIGAAAAVTNVTLNVLLIPRYGLLGCAWATVAAYGVMSLVGECLTCRRLSSRPSWTMLATAPVVASAAYATWRADLLGALGVAVVVSISVALLCRSSLRKGVDMMADAGVVRWNGSPHPRPLSHTAREGR